MAMNKKYVVKLTEEERTRFEGIVHKGKSAAWKIQRAHMLLKCDQGKDGPGWHDERIAEAFGMTVRSVESWRKQAVEEGPDSLLERQHTLRPQCRKLDGAAEAQLVKLACSQAPGERTGWTLNLLADKLVELRMVDAISRETVRRTLKKTTSSHG
jgi:transposase